MALIDFTWYVNFGDGSTTGHFAIAKRPQNTAVAAGVIRRQFTAPTAGNERCWVCIVAGTTANTTDATWTLTRGSKTTDGTATWMECTGQAALNGDLTNTSTWAQAKAATPAVLGQIIKRSNNASYQICTTAGAMSASEPSFSDTAGTTTADTSAVWTSLGVVGNFTGGSAPHARLASVFGANWFASGNTVYIGDNHAEAASTVNLTSSSALLAKVLCHNRLGSYPPAASDLTTGAVITASSFITFAMQGSFYIRGISFVSGFTSGASTNIGPNAVGQVQNWYYFDSCSFAFTSTNAVSLQVGSNNAAAWAVIVFDSTTVKFAAVTQYIWPSFVNFIWQNTGPVLVSGSSVPTTLIQPNASSGNQISMTLEAIDLSQLTGSLFSNNTFPISGDLTIKDCKLNGSATVTTPINTGMVVDLIRCDSAATAYKSSRYAYEGTETTETSITRVNGAVDPSGQAQTRKIVTTANAQWLRPFEAEPYAIWNVTTGVTVTVTVYGTINAGAVPNNDDLWIEALYLSDSGSPLGDIVSTSKATLLSSNAAVASDGSSWNGGGSGAGWSPFKLVATLSSPQPALTGYIDVRVRAAKASTTYYVDPKIELT